MFYANCCQLSFFISTLLSLSLSTSFSHSLSLYLCVYLLINWPVDCVFEPFILIFTWFVCVFYSKFVSIVFITRMHTLSSLIHSLRVFFFVGIQQFSSFLTIFCFVLTFHFVKCFRIELVIHTLINNILSFPPSFNNNRKK